MQFLSNLAGSLAARCLLLTMLLFCAAVTSYAGDGADTGAVYRNPVIPGDFADPSILKVGDIYYAVGTSSEWGPHYPIFTSKDLIQWQQVGYAFPEKPSWTTASFWAPELFYHQGKFYLYYTARDTNNVSYIGVAVAEDPAKGFTDKGIIIKHGSEAIDAFVIQESDGLYISWKAYGLDKRPIELLGSKLSDDGLKLEGEPFSLLKDDQKKGMEGQSIVKRNGYYYLFYSAGGCCGVPCDYHVQVARSKTLRGPYELNPANPILQANNTWMCSGHGTPVQTADNRWFYLYHAYQKDDNVFTGRQGMLDELLWDKATGWPYFKNNGTPSVTAPVPFKGTSQKIAYAWKDDFSSSKLLLDWQWNFRNYTPDVKMTGHQLCLSSKPGKNNLSGAAICVRPAKADYEMMTEVTNQNTALKGLIVYGDDNASAGIGVAGNEVQVWKVEQGKRVALKTGIVNKKQSVQLKIKATKGWQLRFYYRTDNNNWLELTAADDTGYLNANFLKQWDRCPRPGLHQQGSGDEPACFRYFEIKY